MFGKKDDEPAREENKVDELGNVKARLAASESLNKSLVARVAVLENVVKSHGKRIKASDESWQGYSEDMDYLREEREEFKRENAKEHSEFKAEIKKLGEFEPSKITGWGIREQLDFERKRREKIANEKGRGSSGLAGLQSEPASQ